MNSGSDWLSNYVNLTCRITINDIFTNIIVAKTAFGKTAKYRPPSTSASSKTVHATREATCDRPPAEYCSDDRPNDDETGKAWKNEPEIGLLS